MLPILEYLSHPSPTWLMGLSPSDIQLGPGPWRKHIIEDALVYPGSGLDGSPVRQFNGAIDNFIFLDYGTSKSDVLAELNRTRKTGTGFAHHRLVGMVEFDTEALLDSADLAFTYRNENVHETQPPFGIWAVYESNAHAFSKRFSFLFLGSEAIKALAALFPTHAPRGLVVQEHGFGGNCWASFSEQILRLSEKWVTLPELMVLGPNHRLGQWQRKAQALGSDVAIESMHQETRDFLWLEGFAGRVHA